MQKIQFYSLVQNQFRVCPKTFLLSSQELFFRVDLDLLLSDFSLVPSGEMNEGKKLTWSLKRFLQ